MDYIVLKYGDKWVVASMESRVIIAESFDERLAKAIAGLGQQGLDLMRRQAEAEGRGW